MNNVPTGAVVEKAVLLAGRAPSLHNSQPWRWVSDGSSVQLFSVHNRMLPATDTSGRQMTLSCGIALDHFHAAMAAAGWRTFVRRFPDPNRRDHLATVRFGPSRIVTTGDRDRADAIVARYTDRLPFAEPPGWDDFETILRTTFDPADAVLDILADSTRPDLARASELSAALRRYDSSYHAELHWWTGHVVGSAGIPREALTTPQEQERVTIGRKLPATGGEPRRPELGTDRSKILVLSTDADTPEDWLRCGEVLSRVLLECTLAGYATCPLTHLTELPGARGVVQKLTGRTMVPQVVIRVGTAPAHDEPAPTPRLPLADILRMTAPRS
ncbi:NAD(P)H nitroreductase [Nocardia sp. BMG51109]|uniref:Acg family FMN-binding oxidoreductase n=1 Tax=Nocardia sp. BMG51109 TaxID=1056816 RepID=UPI000463C7E6|nr:NAD(P)H nitroreductase [Nocardia sp. BMG51109]